MSDDQIVEYLRARGRVEPPVGLASSIADAVADTPQRRTSHFGLWLPAVTAVGAATLIAVVTIVLGQAPNIGPSPAPSTAPNSTSSQAPVSTAEPTATGELTPPELGNLLEPGKSITLPIQSSEGVSGTITVERGEDVGGYPLVPSPSSELHFFVEVKATYELDVAPETASWGDLDWRAEGESGPVGAELLQAFPQPAGRNYLGTWPGATVPEPRYEGWIIFAVPRDMSSSALELIYQPPGTADATRIALRRPGPAPEPVVVEWPRPNPVYVAQPSLPFTVLESAEADALFVDPDTCTNPQGGYTVRYPDSWYTNTAIGDVPACSWFSPTFYEATESGRRPDEIAIEIRVFEGAIGFIWVDLYTEEVSIDGFSGRRYETGMTKDPEQPTNVLQYSYLAYLDPAQPEGRKLWAFTGTDYGGEYELNRAVFDRIMASLEFTD